MSASTYIQEQLGQQHAPADAPAMVHCEGSGQPEHNGLEVRDRVIYIICDVCGGEFRSVKQYLDPEDFFGRLVLPDHERPAHTADTL